MTNSNTRTQLLAELIEAAQGIFYAVMDGVTPELAHTQPAGSANSIAATVGHLLTSIDGVTNGMLKGGAPVFTAMPTGLSSMPPGGADTFNWYDWGTGVTVDLDVAMQYGAAVFASVADYLGSIDDNELDVAMQTPSGPRSKLDMLNFVVLGGLHQHTGEISALKGIYASLQGFPY